MLENLILIYDFIHVCQDSLTKHSATETDSTGRSGARFLLSSDKKHIIKTIGSEEVAEMHRILKEYHQVLQHKLRILIACCVLSCCLFV